MTPTNKSEIYMAAALGEWSGELPKPVLRTEQYLYRMATELSSGGSAGQDGYTPVKGVDYFTDEDIEEIVTKVVERLSETE